MILLKHVYCLRADTLDDEKGMTVKTYGITALKEERTVPNLFSDRATAKNFVDLCNKEELELVHLQNVIDDLLAGN